MHPAALQNRVQKINTFANRIAIATAPIVVNGANECTCSCQYQLCCVDVDMTAISGITSSLFCDLVFLFAVVSANFRTGTANANAKMPMPMPNHNVHVRANGNGNTNTC